ncbi:activating transcription factor 7-interacting protein 1, partial [Nephila pilipes]
LKHPSPLPPKPFTFLNKHLPRSPPKPSLSVWVAATGIILKWEMPLYAPAYTYAKFESYELFWYEELQNMPVDSQLWKSMGFVQSLPLPMACTLTMFKDKTIHHFAVRAMDIYKRYGDFSNPVSAFYKEEK